MKMKFEMLGPSVHLTTYNSMTARLGTLTRPLSRRVKSIPALSCAIHHPKTPAPSQPNLGPDPLNPQITLDPDTQLPLTPLPPPIPHIPRSTSITSSSLARLHRLAALNPPERDSPEEAALIDDLNDLVGLMDLVKSVTLPDDLSELLSEGVGEVVIGPDTSSASPSSSSRLKEKNGRELLDYATRRIGDAYAHRSSRKTDT